MSLRRLSYLNHDLVVPIGEHILVIDNDCDQTIIKLNYFVIEYFALIQFNVGVALHIMASIKLELFNDAYTL